MVDYRAGDKPNGFFDRYTAAGDKPNGFFDRYTAAGDKPDGFLTVTRLQETNRTVFRPLHGCER